MSIDNDKILNVLTSLTQGLQNQAKEISELKNQLGEIAKFMGQIQEQSELSNSTIVNPTGDFEIAEAITLGSSIEVGADPTMSKHNHNVDEQLLQEEEEVDKATAREEHPLPQPSKAPTPSNLGEVVPNSILSNPIPPNVHIPIPCRFIISKEEESEKDILEALPKQKKEVAGEYQEFIKGDVLETTIPKEVGFYDMGQVITLKTPNLAKFSSPTTFERVFILEFLSEHTKFKPLPDHFKYHLPFKDQFHAVGSNEA
ncbi:hypothetical protein ACFX1S_023336 [Malus domestica]